MHTIEAQRRAQQVAVQALVEAVARHQRRRRGRCQYEARVVVCPEVVFEPDLPVWSTLRRDGSPLRQAA